MMLKTLKFSTLAVLLLATVAQAAVYGTNTYLQEHNGLAYIPMKQSTSGVLGDFNGSRIIGAKADSVVLSQGKSSSGYLVYDLEFDLSNDIGLGGEPSTLTSNDIDTSQPLLLTLNLYDIDFKPINKSGLYYYETLSMALASEGFTAAEDVPQMTIDPSNYGDYRADGYGATNKQQVEYTVDLLDPNGLNLSSEDLDQILGEMKFTLQITLSSYIVQTGPGTYLYRNAKEYLGDYSTGDAYGGGSVDTNALKFTIVPEPTSMAILALGSLALLRRKVA